MPDEQPILHETELASPYDPPEKRAREIAEGIGYACALLHDEYGWSADKILGMLEAHESNIEWDYTDEVGEGG
jgi:hypothetical protein